MIQKEGFPFRFTSSACASCGGACCIGESGYIWISYPEIEAVAEYLKMSIEEFAKRYLIRAKSRYSLREVKSENLGYACIFFDQEKHLCSIYDVRPKQCRTFPFWEQFKNDVESIQKECPGVIVDEKN